MPQRALGHCRSARGPCVRRARVGVASLRQLVQRVVLRACIAAARGARCRKAGSAAAAVICDHRCEFVCQRDAARCGNRAVIAGNRGLGPGAEAARGFSSKHHTSVGGASLQVAGVLWRLIAWLLRAEAQNRVPVRVDSASGGGVLRSSVVVEDGSMDEACISPASFAPTACYERLPEESALWGLLSRRHSSLSLYPAGPSPPTAHVPPPHRILYFSTTNE